MVSKTIGAGSSPARFANLVCIGVVVVQWLRTIGESVFIRSSYPVDVSSAEDGSREFGNLEIRFDSVDSHHNQYAPLDLVVRR